jgi:redox-sensitive bicupin YhaK (pirin superfamily)
MRTIKKLHQAAYAPIGDLVTYRALPTDSMPMTGLDPFIFLNHHGPQTYPPQNQGLPFGPHPHRGFETVTFILEGDIMHQDTGGFKSTIAAGGIQWMTAGSGLIHSEVSSGQFKRQGGPMEILQLWLNLPAKHKMTPPHYQGLQRNQIPALSLDEGQVQVNLVAGKWEDTPAPVTTLTDVQLSWITFQAGGKLQTKVPAAHNIFLYVVKGEVKINGQPIAQLHLAEFNHDGEDLAIQAAADSVILFGHALPYNEPIIAYGPFVMNTEAEIHQAYADYQAGKFGVWRD